MSKKSCTFAAHFPNCEMNMQDQQLDHMIETMQAQIRQDEAVAQSMLASAARSREMLSIIEQLRDENQKLREEKQVINNTIHVGHDYIQEQYINTTPLLPHEQDNE